MRLEKLRVGKSRNTMERRNCSSNDWFGGGRKLDGKNLEGKNFQMVLLVKIAIYRDRGAN